MIYAAVLIGLAAGLRTMTAPAAVSWAAHSGAIDLSATPLFFLGHLASPLIFTALAAVELVVDKLPSTPSRLIPFQLGSRIASGGFCGCAFGLAANGAASGGLLGAALGAGAAVAGAFGGAMLRRKLAHALRRDLPAALIEDVLAVAIAALAVAAAAS